MLPGVSTRALVVNEPMPPTMVPYIGPPLASGPWQARHLASYTALPSATVPRPGGSPAPSGVRMSMFQAARSASLIGWPKAALGRSGRREAAGAAQAAATKPTATVRRTSRDRIAHL